MISKSDIRFLILSMFVLICSIAVMAEDVNFLTNRFQWEKLPTATLMKMGNDFMNIKNMPDSAMLCYSLIANRYNENLKRDELEQCIRATCYTGYINYDFYRNATVAYQYFLKSKELAEKHQYKSFLPHIIMSIGIIYDGESRLSPRHEKRNDALSYYRDAFWKALENKAWMTFQVNFINLSHSALINGQLTSVKKELDTYSQLSLPDTVYMVKTIKVISDGIQLFQNNQLEQALTVFRSVPTEKGSSSDQYSMQMLANEFIYYTLIKLGKSSDALQVLRENEQYSLSHHSNDIVDIYRLYTDFYRNQHNDTQADYYELKWYRTADSLNLVLKNKDLDKTHFLYELDKINEEQRALTLKQQRDREMLWVVSCFLILALLLLALLFINRNHIKRKNRALYENNLALLAADEQRRRIDEEQNRVYAEKYGTTRMDQQSTEELWQNIIHVMEYSQEIFDEYFNVARLAELIGAKPNYVSQAINQHEEWSFSSLLAHYRIREACRRMNDTANYGGYTIEGIAQSVGYSSRSHFVKLFKKQTGLTPSDYIKEARLKTHI